MHKLDLTSMSCFFFLGGGGLSHLLQLFKRMLQQCFAESLREVFCNVLRQHGGDQMTTELSVLGELTLLLYKVVVFVQFLVVVEALSNTYFIQGFVETKVEPQIDRILDLTFIRWTQKQPKRMLMLLPNC